MIMPAWSKREKDRQTNKDRQRQTDKQRQRERESYLHAINFKKRYFKKIISNYYINNIDKRNF